MKCKWCSGPMTGTRRREYCGGKCRVAAWRERRKLETIETELVIHSQAEAIAKGGRVMRDWNDWNARSASFPEGKRCLQPRTLQE